MKKLMIMMLLALMGAGAQAEGTFITRGDTTIITNGRDTVRFLGVNALSRRITALLDDTVLNLNQAEVQTDSISHATTDVEAQRELENLKADLESQNVWTDMLRDIVGYVMTALTFIVLFSLFFYYLHRRRKYKMVEKAIANNYPLPPYVFGAQAEAPKVVYAPAPPPFNPGGEPENAARFQTGQSAWQTPSQTPMTDHIDWRQLKGGFTMAVVGFALMMFFAVTGAMPLTCMFSIVLLLGLGKMWLNYQDQKNAINAWRQQQTWYGTQAEQEPMRETERPQ